MLALVCGPNKLKWLTFAMYTMRNTVSFHSMTALWRSFCEEQQKDVIVIEREIDATGTGVDQAKVFVAEEELHKTEFKANCVK